MTLVQRFNPFIGVGYSWLIAGAWLLSGSSAAVWTRDEDERFLDFQQSLSLDWMADDRWGAYLEWSSLFPEGARLNGMSHALGPGISCNLTRDLQLDLALLFGLDEPSPDVLTQLLFSWRL